MPIYLALLLSVAISASTMIIIIFNLCDDIILDKIFSKLSNKSQSMILLVSISFILIYIGLLINNLINNL
ncbi:hypothetical protein K0040_18360 [Terrisporobacter petrolearius]|uniref:hypothetical protein n=1 Tax=Terrisporobacter petrolearius TaxID=1460447 RepID=UPI001D1670CA|nr:hypothetical protein [Terrisporobacter petrolearius]MCC3866215.1 hypothetical protein [Terrisporobacter petrolearius]